MAETGKQKQAGATPPAAGQAEATPASGERRPSFFSRFLMPPAQRGVAGPPTAQARGQQSPFGKRLMGLVILYFVITVVTLGLQIVDSSVFKNTLVKPWFHTNAFIIGGIDNTYFAVLVVVVAAAYYVLMRFNLIPRDLFFANTRPAATQTRQPGRAAPDGLGAERRTRAARRHSTTTAATRQASTTRRTTTAKAHTPTPPPAPTGHDEEYYRVKAAQRQQRRREAKR